MIVVKYLDLVILAIALPIFVIAGWPLFGYAAAAFAWLVQRVINDPCRAARPLPTTPRRSLV